MNLASERLARSAQNVANVNTPGYQAEHVVASPQAGGGVSGTSQPTYSPAPTFERGREEVLGSNTDMISETAEQLGASQQFKASIALLKTDQDMMQSLLDLKA
jgi:flagellar basal-body rod protein FlgC